MKKILTLLVMVFLSFSCAKSKFNDTKKVKGVWMLESSSNQFEPNVNLSDCEKKTFYKFDDDSVFLSHSFIKEGNCETIKSKNSSYRVEDNQVYINDDQYLSISVEGDKLTTRTTTKRGIDPVVHIYRKVK
ncbi:hypothetical protein CAPN002_05610 [Capnocytophaga stomatis]|uniref:Lipocalin-like domain-containing protein n=2 Tax=Capnocytophaga stomatis TaxID=1848904 RepID=A0A250FX05_9FLAO|nr:hypothetical protein CGC58_02025 [Capnocytophaga stomatis]GIJ93343.1 hypothetical protein CAPN002_05610 [Capnocytophaga stomatis]GIM50226.1 hypothetical protein CAPN003_16780 [Capnocytophaga stomatis]